METIVTKALNIIETCIQTSTYQSVETDRLELKSMSGNRPDDWQSFYETVCAFLNTNGGAIIVGIKEINNKEPKKYEVIGFNPDAETHIRDLKDKFISYDGQPIQLIPAEHYYNEVTEFMGKQIAIVWIKELLEEKRFAFLTTKDKKERFAYRRELTGDNKIKHQDIVSLEERKKELLKNQELNIVPQATINDISLDAVNNYIRDYYNSGKNKGETLKANLEFAIPFLEHSFFIKTNEYKQIHPTLLGLLVCGDEHNLHKLLMGRCQVDCFLFLENLNKTIADKKILIGSVVNLIKDCFKFVERNVSVGIGMSNGGSKTWEYPEELIRETVNNALAHRDYNSTQHIILDISKNPSFLEIRNPGMFQQQQILHKTIQAIKIRRIIPKSIQRNPQLNHILKGYNYWEGRGKGLTALIDKCLNNEIDVPYYKFHNNEEISLRIPKGKVYDETMQMRWDMYAKFIKNKCGRDLTEDEKIVLSFHFKSEQLNREERYTVSISEDNNHSKTIAFLEEKGILVKINDDELPNHFWYLKIYITAPELKKDEFFDKLALIFGEKVWGLLSVMYQEVLNAIYWAENYSNKVTNASNIADLLFPKLQPGGNAHQLANFKRSIRHIFNKLEEQQFIIREGENHKTQTYVSINPNRVNNSLF